MLNSSICLVVWCRPPFTFRVDPDALIAVVISSRESGGSDGRLVDHGTQYSGLDLVGLITQLFLGAVQLLPTAPSGDDGSNSETNLTSFGIVTFRRL